MHLLPCTILLQHAAESGNFRGQEARIARESPSRNWHGPCAATTRVPAEGVAAMYLDTIDVLANTAVAKAAFLKRSPGGFFVSSMMAGAFVGLGIILIFSLGSDVDPAYRAIVMGASFGVALTLVIFAGSDLFTGHTMFMTHGVLRGRTSLGDLAACWTVSWIGNLAGCIVL